MTIGARIKRLRDAQKLTQQQFSDKLGVSRGYIPLIERGTKEPSEQLLLHISRAFGVSLEWLKEGQGEPVYGDRWTLLKERAKELGEDVYLKLITAERSTERLAEIAEQLPKVAEEGFIFSISVKTEIAQHNKKVIENMMGQLTRVINEGDYRKTSALQAFLDVLDPGEKKKEGE